MSAPAPLGWIGIVRLGLVQAAIGANMMLATSLLNRVMVVEYALPVSVPAGLVAWHYAVQLSRPLWGHGSDRGGRRTGWIIAGMALLALGAILAVVALPLFVTMPAIALLLAVAAFAAIGAGVGAAGTSLLALLAAKVAPPRRQAAAATTWTMMIAGIAITAGVVGRLLDPVSAARLAAVVGGVVLGTLLVAIAALWGVEKGTVAAPMSGGGMPGFDKAARAALAEPETRRFTLFVFVSMLAYSMQDLILEPFSGLMFGFSPGRSTTLSGVQHGATLAGMVLAGFVGSAFRRLPQRGWIVGGCIASGMALCGLALAARLAPTWPLAFNVAALGLANGVFSVSALGSMMALAAGDDGAGAGLRLGLWGAAQAVAFGLGGLLGAVAVDLLRAFTGSAGDAFLLVFGAEALLFFVAALLGTRTVALPVRGRLPSAGAMA